MYDIASSIIFYCTDDTAAKVVADNSGEPIHIPPTKP
jgi:hypothetical protein